MRLQARGALGLKPRIPHPVGVAHPRTIASRITAPAIPRLTARNGIMLEEGNGRPSRIAASTRHQPNHAWTGQMAPLTTRTSAAVPNVSAS